MKKFKTWPTPVLVQRSKYTAGKTAVNSESKNKVSLLAGKKKKMRAQARMQIKFLAITEAQEVTENFETLSHRALLGYIYVALFWHQTKRKVEKKKKLPPRLDPSRYFHQFRLSQVAPTQVKGIYPVYKGPFVCKNYCFGLWQVQYPHRTSIARLILPFSGTNAKKMGRRQNDEWQLQETPILS